MLLLNDLILDNFEVEGPDWNQKYYIAYRIAYINWLIVKTYNNVIKVQILVKPDSFNQVELAEKLGVKIFNKDEAFSDKLELPSSIWIQKFSKNYDRIILRIKDDFDLNSPTFLELLKDAYKAFPK